MSKYLIIEDEKEKAKIVMDELISLGISAKSIIWEKTINSGLNKLKSQKFNVIILDLNVPIRDPNKPVENGGITFLEKLIKNPSKYIKPNQIIGLTSFPNLVDTYESRFSALDFSLRNFEQSEWKSTLKSRVLWDLDTKSTKERISEKDIIVLIHGIRTLGKWQKKFIETASLHLPNYDLKSYSFNYFSAFQLLIPFSRKRIINHFLLTITELINENPDSRFSFISHSFGTYVLVRVLENLSIDTEVKIDNIVLAGSVIKEDYNWSEIIRRYDVERIVNECGYNDNILLLSKMLCKDMGMAGRRGFMGFEITNRYYLGGHGFFDRQIDFMEKYWVPIFRGDVQALDERNFGFLRENYEIFLSTRLNLTIVVVLFILILFV